MRWPPPASHPMKAPSMNFRRSMRCHVRPVVPSPVLASNGPLQTA